MGRKPDEKCQREGSRRLLRECKRILSERRKVGLLFGFGACVRTNAPNRQGITPETPLMYVMM